MKLDSNDEEERRETDLELEMMKMNTTVRMRDSREMEGVEKWGFLGYSLLGLQGRLCCGFFLGLW